MNKPLEHNGDNDYALNPGEQSVWITVDRFSVYIRRTAGGNVDVDICPPGDEFEDAPMDAYATSRVYNLPEEEK